MTLSSAFALFSALLMLAIIPGPSVLVVCARTLAGGTKNGLAAIAGVLSSDYLFIVIAVLGLSALAELMGSAFLWIKLVGAAYLVYLGVSIILNKDSISKPIKTAQSGSQIKGNIRDDFKDNVKDNVKDYVRDYASGFLVTMANPKAILFYISFFPAFIDIAALDLFDVLLIIGIATVVLGGVLVIYVLMIQKSRHTLNSSDNKTLRRICASVLVASGVWIASRGS